MLLLKLDFLSTVSLCPARDILHELRFGAGDFLEFLFELFPDSGHGEENSRSSPRKSLDQSASQSIWSREVELVARI